MPLATYLNQDAYRVLKNNWTLYDDTSAATLSLTGTLPEVAFRCRITLSSVTGHTDVAGSVLINAEPISFTTASSKTSTTSLSALPTVTTTGLDCNILIEAIDSYGRDIANNSMKEIACRFQDTQKSFMNAAGEWDKSQAIAYTDETSCDIGTVFAYDGYDYNIAQVSIMTDLDGSEVGRKLWLTGKTESPDRDVEVEEGAETLTRYLTKAVYDVDEDNVIDSSRATLISKVAGATITQYDVVALKSDGTVVPAKADSATTTPAFGWAQAAAALGASVNIAIAGETSVRPDIDLVIDGHVFLSADAAGKVTQTAPSTGGTYIQDLGIASGTSSIIIDKKEEIYRRP